MIHFTINALLEKLYDNLLKDNASLSTLNIVSECKDFALGLHNSGQLSDGYHTFTELYAHRVRLFSSLMHAYADRSWWSHQHHDGTSWEGWILAGIDTPAGPVTYHLPVTEIHNLPAGTVLERGKEWDGHTADDVLERLRSLRSLHRLTPEEQEAVEFWKDIHEPCGGILVAPAEPPMVHTYQYAAWLSTPRGPVHYDGIIHRSHLISSMDDYLEARAEIARDGQAPSPQMVNIVSLSLLGSVPAEPAKDGE